jgi:hypothetical protein
VLKNVNGENSGIILQANEEIGAEGNKRYKYTHRPIDGLHNTRPQKDLLWPRGDWFNRTSEKLC